MRLMSFALTTAQVRARTKTVTRRRGEFWMRLKPGEIMRAVEKTQGLKKGESPKLLDFIRVVDVRLERLDSITAEEVAAEGYPGETPAWFIAKFLGAHRGLCSVCDVTRIAFEYADAYRELMGPPSVSVVVNGPLGPIRLGP